MPKPQRVAIAFPKRPPGTGQQPWCGAIVAVSGHGSQVELSFRGVLVGAPELRPDVIGEVSDTVVLVLGSSQWRSRVSAAKD